MNKKPNPQKLGQDQTLHTPKKFLHRAVKTLRSLFRNLPKTSRSDSIFPDNSSRTSFKNQKLPNICVERDASFTGHTKYTYQEKCSGKTSVTDHSKSKDLKREENAWKHAGGMLHTSKSSFRAAEALAKKMKELEMMDINDKDHVSDIEEILHDYSQLSCPVYLDIVDKFFMDMYTEFLVPLPLGSNTVHSSMRKAPGYRSNSTLHGSMRSFGPIKL